MTNRPARPKRNAAHRVGPPLTGPFLKWAGGKSKLLEQFDGLMPKTLGGRGYVEPFMGSGAVFFDVIQNRKPARCTLLDANPELVNLFVQVRDRLDDLIPLLSQHQEAHNAPNLRPAARKAYYYGVRAARPAAGSLAAAARFLYLNKTCFNGLHRLNSKGGFNVPMGSYPHPTVFREPALRAASALLQGVTLEVCSFGDCERYIADGDFVYLDPPYDPLSGTSSFTAYAKEGFTRDDQTALRDLLERSSHRFEWMLSNSATEFIEALYQRPGMNHHKVLAARSINSAGAGRGRIPELVVRNYL